MGKPDNKRPLLWPRDAIPVSIRIPVAIARSIPTAAYTYLTWFLGVEQFTDMKALNVHIQEMRDTTSPFFSLARKLRLGKAPKVTEVGSDGWVQT